MFVLQLTSWIVLIVGSGSEGSRNKDQQANENASLDAGEQQPAKRWQRTTPASALECVLTNEDEATFRMRIHRWTRFEESRQEPRRGTTVLALKRVLEKDDEAIRRNREYTNVHSDEPQEVQRDTAMSALKRVLETANGGIHRKREYTNVRADKSQHVQRDTAMSALKRILETANGGIHRKREYTNVHSGEPQEVQWSPAMSAPRRGFNMANDVIHRHHNRDDQESNVGPTATSYTIRTPSPVHLNPGPTQPIDIPLDKQKQRAEAKPVVFPYIEREYLCDPRRRKKKVRIQEPIRDMESNEPLAFTKQWDKIPPAQKQTSLMTAGLAKYADYMQRGYLVPQGQRRLRGERLEQVRRTAQLEAHGRRRTVLPAFRKHGTEEWSLEAAEAGAFLDTPTVRILPSRDGDPFSCSK
ncbi:hypothetical protein GGR50DRAFT_648418 [Xylaria sp. CBS 124048]|nr:hypothetical protein GGR50DRAFT_648418 [Xylaria sp. CBS 124048]